MPTFVPPARRAAELLKRGLPLPPTMPTVEDKKWYVLCVDSGKEHKVRAALLKQAKIDDLHPRLYKNAMVPVLREQVPRAGDGKLVMRTTIKYEGYIFLNMAFCPQTVDLVRGVRDAFGLLPPRPEKPQMPPNKLPSEKQLAEFVRWAYWEPVGLESAEAAALVLEQQKMYKRKLPAAPKFAAGDAVAVVNRLSPWFKTTGKVADAADAGVLVVVQMLGKDLVVTFQPHELTIN